MEQYEKLFLEALRCALRGEQVSWPETIASGELRRMFRLAEAQRVLPLVVEASYASPAVKSLRERAYLLRRARELTVAQAVRTAEFLLVYEELLRRGLRPLVLKGAVCRELYPEPEQRTSTDEDLMIAPGDFPACHAALLDCGLKLLDPAAPLEGADEVTYVDDERGLYLELHMRLFSSDSPAYGDCNPLFEGAVGRAVRQKACGVSLWTMDETDHLLFLLCHAYKHVLHGGVGVRQLCDIALYARQYAEKIDWARVLEVCSQVRIRVFSAAIFRIGEKDLHIPAPAVFAEIKTEEQALLEDCLTGGLYGADDPDRLHSSTITLEAVAASKEGRSARGALHSLFLPASALTGRYPYLRSKPWLLPVAWTQRAWSYLIGGGARPQNSIRIGRERIELLKQYQILP